MRPPMKALFFAAAITLLPLAGCTSKPAASIINDQAGPLWCRNLATPPAPGTPTIAQQLDQFLPAYGAKRIVIGHTPILSGIAITEGGRLVRIDTGISSVFGGTLSYLEILDGNLVPHVVARPPPGAPPGQKEEK